MRHRAILLAAAVTLPIPAQSTLRDHDGATAESFHGFAAAGVGDVDGDGFDDYAVGASNAAAGRGEVLVYSGATGGQLARWVGPQAGSRFGWSLTGVGDVNGDGVPDLAVGAPFDSRLGFEAGMVAVYSGADGAQLWSHFGLGGDGTLVNGLPRRYGSRFGWSMVAIDDLDGDGVADLAAGAPSHVRTTSSTVPHNVPYVEIRSGATGTRIATHDGQDEFGYALARIPDMDRDGRDELAISAPWADHGPKFDAGSVTVLPHSELRDRFPTPRQVLIGAFANSQMGRAMVCPGDLNRDLVPDLLVFDGQPDWRSTAGAGVVRLWSLRDNQEIRSHAEGIRAGYGRALAAVGDLTGDGASEYAIGADRWSDFDGLVDVYDGRLGLRIARIGGSGQERFGYALARIGDLDGDGRSELLVGAPTADAGARDSGRTYVMTFADPGQVWTFGSYSRHSAGLAGLAGLGSATAGSGLRLRSGPYTRPVTGVLLIGASNRAWGSVPLPLSLQQLGGPPCDLNVSPDLGIAVATEPAPGTVLHVLDLELTLPVPNASGLELFFQYVPLDPGAPGGFVTTNGVGVRIG